MKKLISLVFVLQLLSACTPWWNVSPEYDPRFGEIPTLGISEPSDAGMWLIENIAGIDDAIHDVPDYWQSPDQTYVWRTGDCEDYTILMMYLLRVELGGWPEMAIGQYDDGAGLAGCHAWVVYDGRWYEAQGGADVTGGSFYTLTKTVPYGEALWRSVDGHKCLPAETK